MLYFLPYSTWGGAKGFRTSKEKVGLVTDDKGDDFVLLGTKRVGWKDVVNLKY